MARTLRTILNEGNPNKLADANRQLQMGEAMALVPRTFRGALVTNILVLPETAKCAAVLSAFATAATSEGQKVPDVAGVVPAAGEAAPNAAGDIAFNATDAVTEAEVVYLAFEGAIVEDFLVVDTGTDIATFLGGRAAAVLISAEALTGSVTGAKTPAPRGGAAATTLCALTDDGLGVLFNAATDAVLTARIRYIAQPGVGDGARVSVSANLDADDKDY